MIRLRIRGWGVKALAVLLVVGLGLMAAPLSGTVGGYLLSAPNAPPLMLPETDWLNPLIWPVLLAGSVLSGLVLRLPFRLRDVRRTLALTKPAPAGRPKREMKMRFRLCA